MAKTESVKKSAAEVAESVKNEVSQVTAAPQSQPVKVEEVLVSEPFVSFERWFKSKGYKPHWKAGMSKFTDITVKRTISDWNLIFKSY